MVCTMLAGCASDSSSLHATNEHIAKLEDKVVELETRITALNDKINLEDAEKPEQKIPTEKVQPAAAAKNVAIPRGKSPTKFADSFQQNEAVDRYREAKILFDSNRPADAILEFADFVKDHAQHPLASNAQYYVGMAYLQQKEYKLAEEELSRLLINYPHSNAVPDTILALIKVTTALQKPARTSYYKEKLIGHFGNSPQAKALSEKAVKAEKAEKVEKSESSSSESTDVEKPRAPEPPTAPVPEMNAADTNGVEPGVVKQ